MSVQGVELEPALCNVSTSPSNVTLPPLKAHKTITKPKKPTVQRRITTSTKNYNPLLHLPPDVFITAIIDQLSDRDIRYLPQVHSTWARLFYQSHKHPHINSTFRHLVRSRYPHSIPLDIFTTSTNNKANKLLNDSWGYLYYMLRRERCHLCSNCHILPFAYAASPNLSLALLLFPSLVIFPVCFSCFSNLLNCSCCSHASTNRKCRAVFIPVIQYHRTSVQFVFNSLVHTGDNVNHEKSIKLQCQSDIELHSVVNEKKDVKSGYQYFDFHSPVQYVHAKPIYQTILSQSQSQSSSPASTPDLN